MENTSCIRQKVDTAQLNRCQHKVRELDDSFIQLANSLEMAGNPIRLKILFLLYNESRLCVCDLSDILGITNSAVSQHLRKMKDRRLIRSSKEGQTIFYTITPEYTNLLKPFFHIITAREGVAAL